MSYEDASRLWEMYQADPAGTHAAVGQQLAEAGYQTTDPRLDQMYGAWKQEQELRAYDAQVAHVTSANPDVDPELYHGFVAAAEGDFDRAVDLYRSHQAAWAAKFGGEQLHGRTQSHGDQHTAADYRGQAGLHKAIEDATAAAFRKR